VAETVNRADQVKPEELSCGLESREGNRYLGGMMYGWI
jgi:hypothetical protein